MYILEFWHLLTLQNILLHLQNSFEKEVIFDELFRVELSSATFFSHDLPIDNSTYVVTRVSLYVVLVILQCLVVNCIMFFKWL